MLAFARSIDGAAGTLTQPFGRLLVSAGAIAAAQLRCWWRILRWRAGRWLAMVTGSRLGCVADAWAWHDLHVVALAMGSRLGWVADAWGVARPAVDGAGNRITCRGGGGCLGRGTSGHRRHGERDHQVRGWRMPGWAASHGQRSRMRDAGAEGTDCWLPRAGAAVGSHAASCIRTQNRNRRRAEQRIPPDLRESGRV